VTVSAAPTPNVATAAALENQFGLADRVVDEAALANSAASESAGSGCRPSHSSRIRRRSTT
jgi:hypothetical protein